MAGRVNKRSFILRHVRAALAGAIAIPALAVTASFAVNAPSASGNGVALNTGDLLVGIGGGKIDHYNSSGTTLLDTLDTTTGSLYDTGMCFDSSHNLYTTNFISNMSKFDSGGTLQTASFGSGFNADPESCVFSNSGDMFVGQADGSHNVLEFTTSGTLINTFSPATENRGTDWVDLASDQCTLSYTSEGSSIKRFNVCTNTQLPDFATGLPGGACYAHRILSDGGELVACTTEIVRTNSSGTVTKTYTPGGSNLFALSLAPDGTSFWTADLVTDQIWNIDISSGTVLTTFTPTTVNSAVAGLAIVGEPTQGSGGSTSVISCQAGQPCSGTANVPGSMSVQVSGQSSSNATIEVQIGVGSANCNDPFFHAPAVTTLTQQNYMGSVNKTVVLTINKAQVAKNANQGLAHFKVCYDSPNFTFTDINGHTVNTGILPNCSAVHNVPPCVTSETKDPAGDVIETFIVPPHDPHFH